MTDTTSSQTNPTPSATAPRQTFVNLPVKDLARATDFFTGLGFALNPYASSDQSACVVISDHAHVMLHVEPYFAEFTSSAITDTSTTREVAMGISAASRDEVDNLVATAIAAGGEGMGEAIDDGSMYMRAFRDLDGHQWSLLYMEISS